VNIGRGLNIKVIVTGIEDDKHLTTIMTLRTDGYQGYILPPVDIIKCKPHAEETFLMPG
jgi:EAL domain-containing protein (putative c-di-GMP-specific phosphodiesterase class I)